MDEQVLKLLWEIKEGQADIRESQARTEQIVSGLCSKHDKLEARVHALEQKPLKRWEGGIMVAISTILTVIITTVMNFFGFNKN